MTKVLTKQEILPGTVMDIERVTGMRVYGVIQIYGRIKFNND